MVCRWIKLFLYIVALAVVVCANIDKSVSSNKDVEARAIEFLKREVPAWSKVNGCFSCHNNGDAARALYVASRKGYIVPDNVLADTTAWLKQPGRWDDNKGDPGFSDKRLADIQFAGALLEAFETGHIKDRQTLEQAARKLAASQSEDGSWRIDAGNTLGSPATYGSHLATYMAFKTLKKAALAETSTAVERAASWLRNASPNNVLTAAALLLASSADTDQRNRSAQLKQDKYLKLIRAAQTSDGGWGLTRTRQPNPSTPP